MTGRHALLERVNHKPRFFMTLAINTFAHWLGRQVLRLVEATGQVAFLAAETTRALFHFPIRWRLVARQVHFIGIRSLSVVVITGAFTGAVFAAQTQFQFGPLGMNSAVGPVVSLSMFRELGPVLCALMLAGRAGSAMAAELATMRITEQVDALRALAVYPVEYLVVPRVLGMVVAMPILVGIAVLCGVGAGYVVAVDVLGVDGVYYWNNTLKFTELKDVWIALTKALLFAILIVFVSCSKGLNSGHGAEGVGQATTQAVVNASIVVLISNFFFTFLLNQVFPS